MEVGGDEIVFNYYFCHCYVDHESVNFFQVSKRSKCGFVVVAYCLKKFLQIGNSEGFGKALLKSLFI
jgi:hypothetical protein